MVTVSKIGIGLHGNPGVDGLEDGTFTEPFPKVKIAKGSLVIWVAKHPITTWKVKFQGSSPFVNAAGDPVFEVTNKSSSQTAVIPGSYHYSVHAMDGVNIWEISGCPELDVG